MKKRLKDLEEENAILKKSYGRLREKPEVKYDFIEKHRHEFRVAKMCKVLGVEKSGYYAWKKREKSKQKVRREKLTVKVKRALWSLGAYMAVQKLQRY